ncbi:MAG: phospholipid carrier-dependent glycosyltransferase [Candidatus Micrarchaeia archaeon]
MTVPDFLKNDRAAILALIALYLALRLPLLLYLPLVQDEAVYSVMLASGPSVIPTFLGHPVAWKPPLFFYVYSPLYHLISSLAPAVQPEFALRLPSLLFGLLTVPPLFMLLRRCGFSRGHASLTIFAFLVSMPSLYPDDALLTDPLMFFLAVCSLYLYSSDKPLLAGAVSFLAFFTKLAVASIIPLLALAYVYTYRRGSIRDPVFLLSLCAVPAAILLNFALFQSAGLGGEQYSDYVLNLLLSNGLHDQLLRLLGSFSTLLSGAGVWFVLSLIGFRSSWKESPFMSVWYCLTLFPLLSASGMPWYYLPVMPAIAHFAVLPLIRWKGKEDIGPLASVMLLSAAVFSLFMVSQSYLALQQDFSAYRTAGLMLAGKGSALIIGDFCPSVVAYKTLMEAGNEKDFGWILSQEADDRTIQTFTKDYMSDDPRVVDGSFSRMYVDHGSIFRKDSSLRSFGMVAVCGNHSLPSLGDPVFGGTGVKVYSLAQGGP